MTLLPHHRLLAAPLRAAEVRWQLTSSRIAVGPVPHMVLHMQALRDVELQRTTVRAFGLTAGVD